jgi:hypothetical protein
MKIGTNTTASIGEEIHKPQMTSLPLDPNIVVPIAFAVLASLLTWGWWITKRSIDQEIATREGFARISERVTACNSDHVRDDEFQQLRAEVNSGFAEMRTLIMQLAVQQKDQNYEPTEPRHQRWIGGDRTDR